MIVAKQESPAARVRADDPRDRWAIRDLIVAWVIGLGWLCLLVSLVTLGERSSTYAELEDGLRSGDIDTVQVIGELLPNDALGQEGVRVRWRDGLGLRTATFTHATNVRMARQVRDDDAFTKPVIVGSVEAHLRSLNPDVRLVPGGDRGSSYTALGHEAPGGLGLLHLVLLVATLVLIAGPRPWRATRWAWGWLVLFAPLVGVPAYFLFGGPTGLFRPRPPGRIWLTGGWAFILAILVGGSAAS